MVLPAQTFVALDRANTAEGRRKKEEGRRKKEEQKLLRTSICRVRPARLTAINLTAISSA
ncbi:MULTISPECIES: hypothetical protein [unclassified Microcoleus]|uniref:hypothetical protein n=1 Tax=unclassified Microcoleus TaxID=2642155 RepID=UPI002FD59C52